VEIKSNQIKLNQITKQPAAQKLAEQKVQGERQVQESMMVHATIALCSRIRSPPFVRASRDRCLVLWPAPPQALERHTAALAIRLGDIPIGQELQRRALPHVRGGGPLSVLLIGQRCDRCAQVVERMRVAIRRQVSAHRIAETLDAGGEKDAMGVPAVEEHGNQQSGGDCAERQGDREAERQGE
jgi:hypothetical protein